MSVSVLLIESNEILRKGLSCSLAASSRVNRVVESDGSNSPVTLARREGVDLAFIGTDAMREECDLVAEFRKLTPRVKCIVLAHDDSRAARYRAIRSGAAGVLGSMSTAVELWQALDSVLAGRSYVAPSFKRSLIAFPDGDGGRSKQALTNRERSVLRLIGEGESNGEIAEHLGVSRRTVDTHRTRLMRKLDIHKTAGLVRYAVREGLVEA